jgi:hypothetical protein
MEGRNVLRYVSHITNKASNDSNHPLLKKLALSHAIIHFLLPIIQGYDDDKLITNQKMGKFFDSALPPSHAIGDSGGPSDSRLLTVLALARRARDNGSG